MAQYKKHDATFKAKVALAALQGDKTPAELTKGNWRSSHSHHIMEGSANQECLYGI